MRERDKLLLIILLFAVCWFLPVGAPRFDEALRASLALVRWYAHEHVLLCLVPAFFIAGAIGLFISQGAVMRCLGPQARKIVAYPVAAVSGSILAVCSCTVLPLFAGIYGCGAGLGPAAAFLYAGPAINILAIIMTARVLGMELGVARAVGAVVFSVLVGLGMHLVFRRDEAARAAASVAGAPDEAPRRRPWQDGLYFVSLIGILIFANWGRPAAGDGSLWSAIHGARWLFAGGSVLLLAAALLAWFGRDELADWVDASWTFAKQILPLLLLGVLVAGFLLGGPEHASRGVIPREWIEQSVGGNALGANLFAAMAGALMYFATLTEVPILEGLLNSGMGQGPALALLLAGPAVSLPNMLVIRSVIGTRKTLVFVGLVVALSTVAGYIYGGLGSGAPGSGAPGNGAVA